MVLGIAEGSLELRVNGNIFSSGQKITGTIMLKPSQPKKARELRVEFYGEVRRSTGRHSHIERVFQVRSALSGERIYNPGETIPFEIVVPAGMDFRAPEGIMGMLMNFMVPRPTFYVHATLDVPNEFDLNRRVLVNIASMPGGAQPSQAAQAGAPNAAAQQQI
ncbi:MAG: hypothetical protein WC861_05630 [Candidatus Micrarchaeia archaeon]|jgi:hypothetical protein